MRSLSLATNLCQAKISGWGGQYVLTFPPSRRMEVVVGDTYRCECGHLESQHCNRPRMDAPPKIVPDS